MANKRTATEEAAPEEGVKTLDFEYSKETKNTFVFAELNEEGGVADASKWLIGNLYVQKSFFDGSKPRGIRVTIQAT